MRLDFGFEETDINTKKEVTNKTRMAIFELNLYAYWKIAPANLKKKRKIYKKQDKDKLCTYFRCFSF